MSPRRPSRVWFCLAAAVLAFAATRLACVRFPAAPARPVAVGLREQLTSLASYDATALAKLTANRERLSAGALDRARGNAICSGLAADWEVDPPSLQPRGNLTLVTVDLRRSDAGDFGGLLRRIRQVQGIAGVSIVGATLSVRGGRLLAELELNLLTHTQPEDDNSSRVLAVVPSPKKR